MQIDSLVMLCLVICLVSSSFEGQGAESKSEKTVTAVELPVL